MGPNPTYKRDRKVPSTEYILEGVRLFSCQLVFVHGATIECQKQKRKKLVDETYG